MRSLRIRSCPRPFDLTSAGGLHLGPTRHSAMPKARGRKLMATLTGGCLCGRVRYTITSWPPISSTICHCRSCQRYTGSSFETFMTFPFASVKMQGDLKTYDDTGGSGSIVHRRFCPHCGSGVVNHPQARPEWIVVLAGTLDDPGAFVPTTEIFCHTEQPWISAGAQRQRFFGGRSGGASDSAPRHLDDRRSVGR